MFDPVVILIIQMQRIVYGFGQFSTNTMHLYQVFHTGPDDSLQTAKLAQQFPAFLRSESRYIL